MRFPGSQEKFLFHFQSLVHLLNSFLAKIRSQIGNKFLCCSYSVLHPFISVDVGAGLAGPVTELLVDEFQRLFWCCFTKNSCDEAMDRVRVVGVP